MSNGGIRLIDGDEPSPTLHHVFGGRLMSSEYVPMDDGEKKLSLHKVHVDLILDSAQYIALLQAMTDGQEISVQLVQ